MRSGLLPNASTSAGLAETPMDYEPGFLREDEAGSLLQIFWAELQWRQESILLFGRKVAQPRLTAWYGDADATYRYSGLSLRPTPWHPQLLRLRRRLERHLCCGFNSVLANAYRNGRDSMGWHRDDEPELGKEPVIASLSLGAARRFLYRPRSGGASRHIILEHGSLLVMKPGCQARWQHAIPKTRAGTGLRINLTFRKIFS